jgi:lysophospholipase L1-like esterase
MALSDIWLIGDSIPYWAGSRALDRDMVNLNLPDNMSVAWWCQRGMGLQDLKHAFQLPALFRNPPKVIFIHVGGNDLTKHSVKFLLQLITETFDYIRQAFPDTPIVWIDILPRLQWGIPGDKVKGIKKKRLRINQFGRSAANEVLKIDIDEQTPGFFRADGVHLSDIGLEFYLDSLKDCILKYLI